MTDPNKLTDITTTTWSANEEFGDVIRGDDSIQNKMNELRERQLIHYLH